MDFLALPRRDLQALCKRNGVRANMTNAAMADALRALPKVDGVEEYVKQPVPVPEPEVKAVVEEKNVGKQGNPLARGRRAVAKSSEPMEPEEDNEDEKGNAKRQSSKEDAQALGVGWRGASRRARPVPVVPRLAAMAGEALKREAKRDNAPAPVVGAPGASRRARPSPTVAAQAVESEVAGAEEEQRAQIPRGRRARAKGSSTEPTRLDDSDDEEMEDAKPEEQQEEEKGDAPAIAVGRRGTSRCARAPSEAPATRRRAAASKAEAGDVAVEDVPTRQCKPTMKTAAAAAVAEDTASRRATRRGSVMSTLLQQEVQEEPQEAVGAPDMAVEAVPIRATATRKSKLTMKAAAVEEKAPPRATRRRKGEVVTTVLQPEAQEEPQDLVIIEDEKLTEETPAEEPSVTDQCTDKSEMQEQLVDDVKCHAPLAIHEESPILGLVSMVTEQASEDDEEAVDAPVSHQRCDALEELAEASDPQKEELNEVDAPKQDKDQDLDIIEDENLMEQIPAEETSVTDQECTDKSEMQEQLVDDEKCHAPLANHEESPILGLVSTVTEQASEDDEEAVDAPFSHQRCDALEELAEASDPQKEELNEVDAPKQDEVQGSNVENVGDKNSAEPMAVLEEKGVRVASECEDLTKPSLGQLKAKLKEKLNAKRVASECEDLTKLSLGQLKAKLKEKLNAKKNKEAKKRAALARVDEKACRSHTMGQQQDLNLQQH